jgi:uncharacterized membrane protein
VLSFVQLERVLLLVATLTIVGSLTSLVAPFTREGFPTGHDATAHITYTYLFDRALSQGQVPVRWVEWVRAGESQPLFNFYPPGLYYLIEVSHGLGLRLSVAYKTTVALLWLCGALFTMAWLRPLGWMPAGLAATLFALSPYALVDGFVRAAYPELAAMAFAPGLFWAIDRLMRSALTRDLLLVACFVCLMLISHLLTSLIFAPVAAAYAGYRMWTLPAPWRHAGRLAAGVFLGIGLAAFYVVPSMVELGHVAIGRMTSGYSAYQDHFVAPSQWWSTAWGYGASVPGLGDDMPLQISGVQWLVIGLATASLLISALTRLRVPHVGALAFWLAAVGVAMFLMTDRSALLWRAIPALPYLQFPWRYFMVISLGSAVLAGLLLASVTSRTVQALLVIGVIGWHYAAHREHLKPASYIPLQAMNIDRSRWAEIEQVGVGAFLERGFTPVAARQEAPAGIGRWTIVDGSGEVRPSRVADDSMTLDVETSTGVRLRLHSHMFPGWRVWVDDEPIDVAIDPRYGFLEVTLGAGTHRVDARFTNTPARTASNAISVVSLGACALVFLRSRRFGSGHA